MKPCLHHVAVFDLGSARTKLILASMGEDGIQLRRFSEETGTAGRVTDDSTIPEQVVAAHLFAIDKLTSIALKAGFTSSLAVATDAFRNARNGLQVLAMLESRLGPISIVDPITEGLVFYSAVQAILGCDEPFCLIDVGGGSVQVVWEHSRQCVKSYPTGTFRLEKDFQGGSVPSTAVYEEMQRHIEGYVTLALPEGLHFPVVVFGSNCMEDFLTSALACGRTLSATDGRKPRRIAAWRIAKLFEEIKGRPYDTLSAYYPANPYFMRGADKALLNLLVVISSVHAKEVIPTNESLGTALARISLIAPHLLREFGISLNRIDVKTTA